MDGFDLVLACCYRVAKPTMNAVLINTSPQPGKAIKWLILAGAPFLPWPEIYNISFSRFLFCDVNYFICINLRPAAIKYRNKLDNHNWRTLWWLSFYRRIYSRTAIWRAVGNTLQGVPFHYDQNLQSYYTGTLLRLLNPFALLCGFVSIMMLIMHGRLYLTIKTETKYNTALNILLALC